MPRLRCERRRGQRCHHHNPHSLRSTSKNGKTSHIYRLGMVYSLIPPMFGGIGWYWGWYWGWYVIGFTTCPLNPLRCGAVELSHFSRNKRILWINLKTFAGLNGDQQESVDNHDFNPAWFLCCTVPLYHDGP